MTVSAVVSGLGALAMLGAVVLTPTPASAQFRRGGGVAAGVLVGAVLGAMVAGSSRRAVASPRSTRQSTRSASRSRSTGSKQTAGDSKIDANATMQNANSNVPAPGATASKDPFANPSTTQTTGSLPAR